jgi:hypothetical protein
MSMNSESIQSKLRKILVEQFNESEMRDLCFDLNIDHEMLLRETKGDLARELVSYCERHDVSNHLVKKVLQLRPNASLIGKVKDVAVTQVVYDFGIKRPEVRALVMFMHEDTDEYSYAWVNLESDEADTGIRLARAIENRLLSGETPIPEEARVPKDFLKS